MRILMLVASDVVGDVRVVREARALAERGHRVLVVGRDVPAGGAVGAGVQIFDAPAGSGLRGPARRQVPDRSALARALRWLLLPEHRRLASATWVRRAGQVAGALEFDAVHAHDFTALGLGARLARARRVPLVYDAHELWTERHRSGRPTPVERRRQRAAERRLGARSRAVITVSEPLAQRLRAAYRWDHVAVVRNTFPPAAADGAPVGSTPSAGLYAGRLGPGRDLETVAAASRSVDLPLRLVGPSDATWLAGFVPRRCETGPPVPPEDVVGALRAAGLALVTLADGWDNHRVALPNKLFQAMAAGVPVVASDVGELSRFVRRHGVGVLYRAGDATSFAAAVDEARARFPDLVDQVRRVRHVATWASDRDTLLAVYDDVGAAP